MVLSLFYSECLLYWLKCNYNSSQTILEMNNYLPTFFTSSRRKEVSLAKQKIVDLNTVEKKIKTILFKLVRLDKPQRQHINSHNCEKPKLLLKNILRLLMGYTA